MVNMGLKNITLKHYYDSDEDDILNDFYIPALKESCVYYRLAGFFSSSSLAAAARGIKGLIENDGEMKLITGAVLSKQDIEAIKKGIERPEEVIERVAIKSLDEIEDEFVRDHVRALSWMVAQKKLDIKIAIVVDDEGIPVDKENINQRGIFHQKVGIFEDAEGNKLSFSGSDNESATAWKNNIEEFKVFRSWISAEGPYLEADLKRFKKFWYGNALRARVIDIPTAVREKLVKMAPSNIKELDLDRWKQTKKIIFRPYQKTAIERWIDSNKKGIFEMATGTGKTFTALGCLDRVLKEEKRLVAVIVCPYNHLIKQWSKEIDKFGLKIDKIIADSSNPKWKNELADYLLDIKSEIRDKIVVLTTHDTFPRDDFTKIIRLSPVNLFLIVDEVHGIGSPIRKTGLIEDYKYRLGLSATPKRWLDDEGTEYIFEYFGEVVYGFSLKDAINTINPDSGETYLTPYIYKPYFIELSEDEILEYERETKKIARSYYRTKNEKEKRNLFSLLLIKRQKIIVNAANKFKALSEILNKMDKVSHCLIYCSPKQIDKVQEILNERNIVQHKFTLEEGTKPEDRYGGISEREFILKKFAEGNYQALVAMKCLDEGVDIPPARTAIILASSGNPRQYIQRRGRILRNYPGKDYAIIYDIIVAPPFSDDVDEEIWELERKIIKKELKRYKEFAYLALNKMECLNKIENLERKYRVVVTTDW